jgi:hypothetical protein
MYEEQSGMREPKKEPKRCSKCGVELTLQELRLPALNVEGNIYDITGLCYICHGDIREHLGLSRKEKFTKDSKCNEI